MNPLAWQIVADIGNHATKIAVSPIVSTVDQAGSKAWDVCGRSNSVLDERQCHTFRDIEQLHVGDNNPLAHLSPARWLMASVNPQRAAALVDYLKRHRPEDCIEFVTRHSIPMTLDVDFPDRVGIDRVVAAWQAFRLVGAERPVIVIDSGTAVTVDCVARGGIFMGGAIFPGNKTCFDSLQRTTAQLPGLESASLPTHPCGRYTEQAIASGVLRLQIGGLLYLVQQIQHTLTEPASVVMTGGGLSVIRPSLPPHWRYESHLILEGLLFLAQNNATPVNQDARPIEHSDATIRQQERASDGNTPPFAP